MLNFDNCFGLILGDAFPIGEVILEMLIKVNMYCMDICGLRLCWLTKEEYKLLLLHMLNRLINNILHGEGIQNGVVSHATTAVLTRDVVSMEKFSIN